LQTDEQRQWLWASFKPRYFPRRHKLRDEHTRWWKVADLLHKWSARFDKEFLRGLEDESRTLRRRRTRAYTARQYERVVRLRRQHLRYGKMKLLERYRRQHAEDHRISTWKI
jgi:hypothetical protein